MTNKRKLKRFKLYQNGLVNELSYHVGKKRWACGYIKFIGIICHDLSKFLHEEVTKAYE